MKTAKKLFPQAFRCAQYPKGGRNTLQLSLNISKMLFRDKFPNKICFINYLHTGLSHFKLFSYSIKCQGIAIIELCLDFLNYWNIHKQVMMCKGCGRKGLVFLIRSSSLFPALDNYCSTLMKVRTQQSEATCLKPYLEPFSSTHLRACFTNNDMVTPILPMYIKRNISPKLGKFG